MKPQPRQPKGVPVGGRFAPSQRSEPSIDINEEEGGEFSLHGGGWGNPGCDQCGTYDAIQKIDNTYWCGGCLYLTEYPGAAGRNPDS